ncbi:MAG: hypothetical protein HY898_34895 [Deltaproteobacteria bacterium]|nr:hypothetical protein [Deltaproteobacteria bacterium]
MGEPSPASDESPHNSTMVPPAPSDRETELFLLEFDDEEWGDELGEDTYSDADRITQVDDLRVMVDELPRSDDDQGPPTIPSPCPWLDAAVS